MVRAMKAKKSLPGPKMTKKSLKPLSALQQAMQAFEDAPGQRWVMCFYDRERDELYTPSWRTTISGRMYFDVWMNASSLNWRTRTTHNFDAALDSPYDTDTDDAMKVKKAKKGMKKLAKP
eukprot:NODE_7653_length_428_cov_1.402145.p1 GENE.NODE_7653_length_428_cov_1.402145~~NODE_7653_length_428_cov_1.402145.p1  ORF type:complete len:120 (+),score=31.24 NODE_7653_length_428_cov_1.402145:28-387(+)